MKWCFLINQAPYLAEFFGKLAHQVQAEGDEYIVVTSGRIAEWVRTKYFPTGTRYISKVDWCRDNWKPGKQIDDISWKQFFSDYDRFRNLSFSYENAVAVISQYHQFFEWLFQAEKPDIVLNEPPANPFTEIALHVARKHGISYLGFMSSRLEGRIDVFDTVSTNSQYEKTYETLGTKDITESEKEFAQKFVQDFISHKKIPPSQAYQYDYLNSSNFLIRYVLRETKLVWPFLRYLRERRHIRKFDDTSETYFRYDLRYPFLSMTRKLRALIQAGMFDAMNEEDKFFLFPLHMQPEASTSVLATYMSNQLNTVRNVAFSLPFPYKLYVREHPSALGHNSLGTYRAFRKIPNVVLLPPRGSMQDLIRKSQGVITLTSTIGMESALAGKLTYVLGNVFYSYHPACRQVCNFDELEAHLREDLSHPPSFANLQEVNTRFLVSYLRNTIPGNVISAIMENDTNDYHAIYQETKRLFL